jgi:release factor glutamine methyltransferase
MFSQEAEWLLGEKYNGEKTVGFFTDVEKLEAGEPLAYLIGHIPFLDSKIYLDSRPLIPRPETEFWVKDLITKIYREKISSDSPLHILDLCAGSGCIGVAIAAAIPEAKVDFLEIEERHLSTITKNCFENNLEKSRFNAFQGNLFLTKEKVTLPYYDFIITNPPYIDPTLDRTEKSVKDYEPSIALYGGQSGMEIITRIITQSPEHLKKGGQLWIEHEPEQAEEIKTSAGKIFTANTYKDQYGLLRYTKLVLQ